MTNEGEYTHLLKIILVGDATVGKTHLLSRFTRNTLPKAPQATIGVEFAPHTVRLPTGGLVKAQIWDTAGQERYRAVAGAHYRRAVGALLVYDVTRKQSFVNASKWLEELRSQAEPDIVVMLVGNKVDLVDSVPSLRDVPYELAAQFAQRNGLMFLEASAVTTHNVRRAFESLLQEIVETKAKNLVQDHSKASTGVGLGTKPRKLAELYKAELHGGINLDSEANDSVDGCCGFGR